MGWVGGGAGGKDTVEKILRGILYSDCFLPFCTFLFLLLLLPRQTSPPPLCAEGRRKWEGG